MSGVWVMVLGDRFIVQTARCGVVLETGVSAAAQRVDVVHLLAALGRVLGHETLLNAHH